MMYPERGTGGSEGTGLNSVVLLSLLVHLLLLSLLFFLPSRSTPRWTFGPVYSVQLVSMPASMPARSSGAASFKEIMAGAPSDRHLLKKESVDNLPAVPIGPVEVRKKSAGSVENVVEKIRKNVQSAANLPVAGKALKETERVISPPASSSSRQGDAELNAKMRTYYTLIWSRIKGRWTLPQGILPQENIEVIIHAQILRDGTVAGVAFEKRSGNRYFDESAFRTVKKASPFPPLPDGLKDSSIEVGIRFHSSEFR